MLETAEVVVCYLLFVFVVVAVVAVDVVVLRAVELFIL